MFGRSRSLGCLLVPALAACGAEADPVQLDTGDPCAVIEPIEPGASIRGRLDSSDCHIEDYVAEHWGLSLGGPATLRIEASSQTTRVLAELRTPDGTVLAAADNGGTDEPGVIEETLDAGSYVIVVSLFWPGGVYDLAVTLVGGP